jgi:hypothetical protein
MKSLFLCSVCLLFSIKSLGLDLEYIRNNYQQAVTDKKLCETMIAALEETASTNVHLAYLGALQTIWANHVFNPFSKLSTFKKGKATIEKAIKNDSENVEIRYVRLSIQQNCPSFLGYNKNIKEDKEFLKKNKETVTSVDLTKMINSLLNKEK